MLQPRDRMGNGADVQLLAASMNPGQGAHASPGRSLTAHLDTFPRGAQAEARAAVLLCSGGSQACSASGSSGM